MSTYRNGKGRAYLSYQICNPRHRFSLLMASGGRALSIPVLEFIKAFQVKKSSQSCAVVIDNSEILILDCTAYLQNISYISKILAEEHTELASSSCCFLEKGLQEFRIPIGCLTLRHNPSPAVQEKKGCTNTSCAWVS